MLSPPFGGFPIKALSALLATVAVVEFQKENEDGESERRGGREGDFRGERGAMGLLLIVRAFSVILAYVYPAYASYKALESNGPEGPAQWLTYWIVLSLFNVLEFAVEWALSWYGLIYWIKLGFVMWLQLPQFRGAQFLYVKFLHPQFKKHESRIDVVLDRGVQGASSNLHRLQERWPNLFNRAPSVADRMLEELEEADTGPKGE